MNTLQILLTGGMKGEPLPYLLRTDWVVTSLLFLCIFSFCYFMSKEKKHLQIQFRSLFTTRERASLFDDATGTDLRHTIGLILHSCTLLGVCIYYYFSQTAPEVLHQGGHLTLLGSFIGLSVVYLITKWGVYQFVNWLFFEKNKNSSWTNTFFNVVVYLGIFLLPVVLLVVYFDLSPENSLYSMAAILILAKILLFWNCFNNFFNKIHGFFHLILYFCALEILPDLILWKGLIILTNKLILNI